MECDRNQGCAAGLTCTEVGRCARRDAACDSTSLRYDTGGECVPSRDIDGIPNSCQKESVVSSWKDPGYCNRYRRPIGFLGLFVTPYALAYAQAEGDNEATGGIELYAAGRLGVYRYERGETVAPRVGWYLAAFGQDYFADDGHIGARLGLKLRIVAWPGFLHFLTDVATRVGLSAQYIYGEAQADGHRSHFTGLLLEIDFLHAISVGGFGQLDANHDSDMGFGGLIRFDLSDLKELGILE
jgi:hypothetical protein